MESGSIATDQASRTQTAVFSVNVFLTAVGLVLLVATCCLFWLHTNNEINWNHLTDAEKEAAERGVYEVETIRPDTDGGPIVFNDPVQFLSDLSFLQQNGTFNMSTLASETFIRDVFGDDIFIPNPNDPQELVLLSVLVQNVTEVCDATESDAIQVLLLEIITLLDSISNEVLEYQTDLSPFIASYEARNATFWTNEDRINSFNLTCNGSQIATFISTYNATELRLELLIQAYEVNLANYTALLAQYDSLVNQTDILLTANCSAISDLQVLLMELQMDYAADVVTYTGLDAQCENCTLEVADAETRLNTLILEDIALTNRLNLVDNETQALQINTTTLLNQSNQTLQDAVVIQNDLTSLVSDYELLNITLSDLKANATILRDLAAALNVSTSTLSDNIVATNTSITLTQALVDQTIVNCTGVNITNVQDLLTLFETLIANITAMQTLVNGEIADLASVPGNLTDLENRVTVVETTLITIQTVLVESTTRYNTLNATYYSLLGQYNVELARFTTLNTTYFTELARLVPLNTTLESLQTFLDSLNASVVANNATLVLHESRIAALEPDLGCTGFEAGIGITPGLGIPAIAGQDMQRGMPVVPRPGSPGMFSPARGVRFQDFKNIVTVNNSVDSTSLLSRVPSLYTIDAEDFMYFAKSHEASDTFVFEGELFQTTGVGSYCLIGKLSPSKDIVWLAYAVSNAPLSVFCGGVQYNQKTKSIWISLDVEGNNSVPGGALVSLLLFGANDLVNEQISTSVVGISGALVFAEISQSGRWQTVDVLTPLYTSRPASFYPRLELESPISVSRLGALCLFATSSYFETAVLFSYNNVTVLLPSTVGNADRLFIICYDTVSKTPVQIWKAVEDYQPTSTGLDRRVVHFDTDETAFVLFRGNRGDVGEFPVVVPLVDGTTKTFDPARVLVGRFDPYRIGFLWIEGFRLLFDIAGVLTDAMYPMERELFVFIRSSGSLLAYSNPTSTVLPTLTTFLSIDKSTGTLISTQDVDDFQLTASDIPICYDPRNDHLYFLNTASTPPPIGTTPVDFSVFGETFRTQYLADDIAAGGQSLSSYTIFRLDGSSQTLGAYSRVQFRLASNPFAFNSSVQLSNDCIVNSHGVLHVPAVSPGNMIAFADTSEYNVTGLFQRVVVDHQASSELFMGLATFSSEDIWPTGIITGDALFNDPVTVVTRGTTSLASTFDSDDTGGLFATDVAGGNTITRTRTASRSQIGFKTDAADQFLVDIHTSPLIGSDE